MSKEALNPPPSAPQLLSLQTPFVSLRPKRSKYLPCFCFWACGCVLCLCLAGGLGGFYLAELSKVEKTICTLNAKQEFNESCGLYKVEFEVLTPKAWGPLAICSATSNVKCSGGFVPKGPASCYGIYSDTLAQYNYLQIGNQTECYIYNPEQYVFFDDPTVYTWRKIEAAIAMAVLGVVCWIFQRYGGHLEKFFGCDDCYKALRRC